MVKESEKIKRILLRLIGVAYLFLGFLFVLNSSQGITGFAIFSETGIEWGFFLGIVFFVIGVLVLEAVKKSSHYNKIGLDYYIKRANEITKYRGDVWISQWESDGLLNELKDRGYHLEHDLDKPAMHLGSLNAPSQRHLHIESETGDVDKHLFITPNPYDERLQSIGVLHGKRMRTRVYHPMHPRSSGNEKKKFTDKTQIT